MIASPGVHFRYDSESHTYYLGDQILPHPTGVLTTYHDFGGIPKDVLDIARVKGISIHEYVAAYNNNTLDMDNLPESIEGFDIAAIVRGYERDIYKNLMLIPYNVETPMLHKERRYGCTPDFLSGSTTFDEKPMSRINDPLVGIQLAANAGAAISNGLIDPEKAKTCSVHYDKLGNWKHKYWNFKEDWQTWCWMLNIYNRLNLGGK